MHEVQDNGTLKELHKANGGNWGGTMVDSFFRSLLASIVGNDVIEAFTTAHKYDYLELLRDFEIKKRTIHPHLAEKVTFKVPINLLETFREVNPGKNIKAVVTSNARFKNQLTWTGDKIRMEANLTKALFDESCKKKVYHMNQLFEQPNVKEVSSILLVGGFAESPMLQEAVKEAFRNKKVIVPQDAGLAVLKGAVMYGHDPTKISGRVCKYTYGVESYTRFDNSIHPQSKKDLIDGIEYCKNIFNVHVSVGNLLKVGEPQVRRDYTVTSANQTALEFNIYTSNEREPTYTTDVGCTRRGKLTIAMPDTTKGKDRGAFVHMTFSGTEITVTAVDKDDSTKTVSTSVNFLG